MERCAGASSSSVTGQRPSWQRTAACSQPARVLAHISRAAAAAAASSKARAAGEEEAEPLDLGEGAGAGAVTVEAEMLGWAAAGASWANF
jgi:hypothetical protein